MLRKACASSPTPPATSCAPSSARTYADLELRDLDPRTIVRRHIIEAMEEAEERGPAPARGRRARSVTARSRRTTSRRPEPQRSARLCTAADAPRRRPAARARGATSTSTKSAPTRRTRPSCAAAVDAGAPRTAPGRRRACAAPSPGRAGSAGDHATSGTDRAEAPRTASTAARCDDPVLRRSRGPGTSRCRPAAARRRPRPTPATLEHDLAPRPRPSAGWRA